MDCSDREARMDGMLDVPGPSVEDELLGRHFRTRQSVMGLDSHHVERRLLV